MSAKEPWGEGTHIHLIDDSATFGAQVGKILEKQLYRGKFIFYPLGTIYLRAEADYPELIILDLSMPIMDGIEVLKELQVRRFSGKIIICSADADMASRCLLEGFELDIVNIFMKPLPTKDFLRFLKKCLS